MKLIRLHVIGSVNNVRSTRARSATVRYGKRLVHVSRLIRQLGDHDRVHPVQLRTFLRRITVLDVSVVVPPVAIFGTRRSDLDAFELPRISLRSFHDTKYVRKSCDFFILILKCETK